MVLKPDLILIPGWSINAAIFRPFTYLLNEVFNCHLITPPLLEDEHKNAYEEAVSAIVNYVEEKQLAKDNLSILGWSMGGQIALKLASRVKVKRLFLLNSAAIFSRNEIEKASFYELCSKDFKRAIKYFHKLMGKINLEDSILLSKNFIYNKDNALNYLRQLHGQDLTTECKKLSATVGKVIIIHSEKDAIIPYAEAEYLHSLIKDSKLVTLKGDNHFPFFWAYDKISDILCNEN